MEPPIFIYFFISLGNKFILPIIAVPILTHKRSSNLAFSWRRGTAGRAFPPRSADLRPIQRVLAVKIADRDALAQTTAISDSGALHFSFWTRTLNGNRVVQQRPFYSDTIQRSTSFVSSRAFLPDVCPNAAAKLQPTAAFLNRTWQLRGRNDNFQIPPEHDGPGEGPRTARPNSIFSSLMALQVILVLLVAIPDLVSALRTPFIAVLTFICDTSLGLPTASATWLWICPFVPRPCGTPLRGRVDLLPLVLSNPNTLALPSPGVTPSSNQHHLSPQRIHGAGRWTVWQTDSHLHVIPRKHL
ncbi:hypothetical protein J3R82DRAFT_8366 [Butyriboletus roseoflavus]|nr:hypothetical protein J3R82DRAFT_8366 [Butyriboletus roseoflavus]